VTLLTVEKLHENLRLDSSSLRRAVVVVYWQTPQSHEEHTIWEAVTRFLGSRSGRSAQIDELLKKLNSQITGTPVGVQRSRGEYGGKGKVAPQSLCMACMSDKGGAETCPRCGWTERTSEQPTHQPPLRTLLNNRYLIGRALAAGGFAITYMAWDLDLSRKVLVKEYFPTGISLRSREYLTTRRLSPQDQGLFEYGMKKFVEEGEAAQARFHDNPAVTSVDDLFYANGTAYVVAPYWGGQTLQQYLDDHGGKIPLEEALSILIPLMDGVGKVHETGMLHRDINPDNVHITQDRQVKILDFGMALVLGTRASSAMEDEVSAVGGRSGYAPVEQFMRHGQQGPWTDVYALGATIYRAITGQVPSAP